MTVPRCRAFTVKGKPCQSLGMLDGLCPSHSPKTAEKTRASSAVLNRVLAFRRLDAAWNGEPSPALLALRDAGRAAVIRELTNEAGKPLAVLPWWEPALAAMNDPTKREIVLHLPRQSGKSQFLAVLALTELLTRPGAFILLIAAGADQATAIFARKVRRPLERLLREKGIERRHVIITRRSVEFPDLGAKLEVVPTTETTTPGRSVSLLLLDECRDIPDSVISTVVPSRPPPARRKATSTKR
jgi:terminase large subunit-like protein